MTHTYVLLPLSRAAYDEVLRKLREAGYDHAINEVGEIDMHGLAVVAEGGSDGLDLRRPSIGG